MAHYMYLAVRRSAVGIYIALVNVTFCVCCAFAVVSKTQSNGVIHEPARRSGRTFRAVFGEDHTTVSATDRRHLHSAGDVEPTDH